MKKRLLSLVLALALALSLAPAALAADIPSMAHDEAETFVENMQTNKLGKDAILIYYSSEEENSRIFVPQYVSFAQEKGLEVSCYDDQNGKLEAYFDLLRTTSVKFPAVVVMNSETNKYYYYPDNPTCGMDAFVKLLNDAGVYSGTYEGPAADAAPSAESTMTDADIAVRDKMLALKAEYPEGMSWTDDNSSHTWPASINNGTTLTGHGCAAFAMLLSDAAFGEDAMVKDVYSFKYEDVRAGTMLRLDNNTHSVIVLETYPDYVVVAEGNYNSSVHWGRQLSKSAVMASDYITVRGAAVPGTPEPTPSPTPAPSPEPSPEPTTSPEPTASPEPTTSPEPDKPTTPTPADPDPKPVEIKFEDVPAGSWVEAPVKWAVDKGITTGTHTEQTAFTPDRTCSVSEILTFLYRAKDKPETTTENPFTDVKADAFYADPAVWAYENKLVSGEEFKATTPCTRAMVVTYLWKLAGSPEVEVTTFTDVTPGTDAAWAAAWAVQEGITKGTNTEGTAFSPERTCTRGEIVTFLYRAYAE